MPAVSPLMADAEAEVDQRGDADEEAHKAVHAVDRERGEKAEGSLVRDGIAKEGEEGRHGRRGRTRDSEDA